MTSFPREMADAILVTMTKVSDAQMEPYVRDRVTAFLAAPRTSPEVYDFLVGIAVLPCTRIGETRDGRRVYSGDVSGFIQAACDLTPYYTRPELDEPRTIDVARVSALLESSAWVRSFARKGSVTRD